MRDISELRAEIDEIDAKMIELFEKRMDVCLEVADYKIANNKPVLDESREAQKLSKVEAQTKNVKYKEGSKHMFELIMAESRKLQSDRIKEV